MVYEPFLLDFSFLYFGGVFDKSIIPLAFVGHEMVIADSARRAALAISCALLNKSNNSSIK